VIRCVIRLAAAAFVLAPASAGAGAGTALRPPVALSVSPARVTLAGAASRTIEVTNRGSAVAVVDIASAGFALSLRGRPKVVAAGQGTAAPGSWLTPRPQRLTLPPGRTASLSVSSAPPAHAEPGDHAALVLLSTRPGSGGRVAVLMRVGVVVNVRVAGAVVRHLELRRLHVRRAGRARILELLVANRGNVTEMLQRGRVHVTLRRGGRTLARLHAAPRELLPRTSGLAEIRYPGRLRGAVTARVEVDAAGPGGSVWRRTFRLRL